MRRILFEEIFSEYRDGDGAWYVLWHESKGNEPGIERLVMQASPLCLCICLGMLIVFYISSCH